MEEFIAKSTGPLPDGANSPQLDMRICETTPYHDSSREHAVTLANVRGSADTIWKSLVEFQRQLGRSRWDRFRVIIKRVGQSATIDVPFLDFWRTSVTKGLQRALERDELHCCYQPIVRTRPQLATYGFELLVRYWDRGEFELTPSEIFRLGSDPNMELQIQRLALDTCLQGLRPVPDGKRVFINVNPELFFQGLVNWRQLKSCLQQVDLPWRALVLEIVESRRPYDCDNLRDFAADCRRHGIGVAIDDLGNQCRGLEMLNAVRPDFVKMEMELVRGCHRDPYRSSLISGVVTTCAELGTEIILEGIETAEDFRWQQTTRSDFAQGFLFGRPLERPELVLETERVRGKPATPYFMTGGVRAATTAKI